MSTPRTPRPISTVAFLILALALTIIAVVAWAHGDIAAASWLMLAALAGWTFGLARAQPHTHRRPDRRRARLERRARTRKARREDR